MEINTTAKFRKYALGCTCIVAMLMVAFHEYTTATLPLTGFMQTAVHLVMAIGVIGLGLIARNTSQKITCSDMCAAAMIFLALIFNIRILMTGGFISAKVTARLSASDMVIAIIAIVSVLIATYYAIGAAMVWVSTVFLAYAFLGPLLPGILHHNGITLRRLLSVIYLTNEGIYGSALRISASEIFPLMIYGGIMVGLGGGDLMVGIAQKSLGVYRGGIAKVSVLASALFGMISGAGPANAATTGMFVIPMMKKHGYAATFAAATVATASIGGQIMPPIMGASAFIMAEYLGVSYGTLILCAFPPAILYYVAVFLAVDIEAQKLGLMGLPRSEIPPLAPVMKEHWHFLISIAVLVTLLIVFGYGPGSAGFWATVTMIITEAVYCIVRRKKLDFRELMFYLVDCTRNASGIAVSCACAGIILGVVDRSGLAVKMTSLMLNISGGNLTAMLLMAAVASLVMGMALPTVACFIVVATMVAPSLINAGVNPYAAYFFAFYFGMVSNITPPVALTAYVAAGIAEASPLKTAITATRIGIAAYILPFIFVFSPGLLLQGSWFDLVYGCTQAAFIIFTTAVVFGGMWFGVKISVGLRFVMLGSVVCIFGLSRALSAYAYAVTIMCFVLHYFVARKRNVRTAAP